MADTAPDVLLTPAEQERVREGQRLLALALAAAVLPPVAADERRAAA